MLAEAGGTSAAPRRSTRRSPDAGVGAVAVAGADAAVLQVPDASRLKAMDPSNVHVLLIGNLGRDDVSGEAVSDVLRASYRVSSVASDVEALQLLRGPGGPGVDLILKEHEPPSCDAVKLLSRLAKSAPLRHIPVVVVSSRGDKAQVADALHAGAVDYLVKPLRRNELSTMWAHVWRRVMLTGGAQPAGTQLRSRRAAVAPGSDESSGEGSGQGSYDAEQQRGGGADVPGAQPPAPQPLAAAPREPDQPARPAVTRTLPAGLEGPLFKADGGGGGGGPVGGATTALPVGEHAASAFLAYASPGRRTAVMPEPSSRPWPQDPMLAAAAAAASMAVAGASMLPRAPAKGAAPAAGAAAAATAPYGMPFVMPATAFAHMFPPDVAAAAAVTAQQPPSAMPQQMPGSKAVPPALGAVVSAYGLRQSARLSAGGLDASGAAARDGSAEACLPIRDGSGSDDAGGCSNGYGGALSDAAMKARRAAALKKFKEKRANRCFVKKIRYNSRKQLAEARPRNRGQFVRVVKMEEPGQEEGAALLALATSL